MAYLPQVEPEISVSHHSNSVVLLCFSPVEVKWLATRETGLFGGGTLPLKSPLLLLKEALSFQVFWNLVMSETAEESRSDTEAEKLVCGYELIRCQQIEAYLVNIF